MSYSANYNNVYPCFSQIPLIYTERFIILDTETTGLNRDEGHHILEIAAIEMKNGFITGNQFHAFIRPRRSITLSAKQTHKMGDDFFVNFYEGDYMTEKDMMQNLLDFIGDSLIFTHNAQFDFGFINQELKYNNLPEISDKRFRCTMQIFKNIFSKKLILNQYCKGHGLKNACDFFSIKVRNEKLHGALYDAMLAAKLLKNIFEFLSKNPDCLISGKITEYEYILNKKKYYNFKNNTKLSFLGSGSKSEAQNNSNKKIYLDKIKEKLNNSTNEKENKNTNVNQNSNHKNNIINNNNNVNVNLNSKLQANFNNNNNFNIKQHINSGNNVSLNISSKGELNKTLNFEAVKEGKIIECVEIKNNSILDSESEAANSHKNNIEIQVKNSVESLSDKNVKIFFEKGLISKEEFIYNLNFANKKNSFDSSDRGSKTPETISLKEEELITKNFYDENNNLIIERIEEYLKENNHNINEISKLVDIGKEDLEKKLKWMEFQKKKEAILIQNKINQHTNSKNSKGNKVANNNILEDKNLLNNKRKKTD